MYLIEEIFPFVYVHILKHKSLIMCVFCLCHIKIVRGVLNLGR
jgi:hypothetical protein